MFSIGFGDLLRDLLRDDVVAITPTLLGCSYVRVTKVSVAAEVLSFFAVKSGEIVCL